MSRSICLAPRLFVLAALTVPAAALDAVADPIDDHGVWLGAWADRATRMLEDPVRYRPEDSAAACDAAIAKARADGITDTQRVASYNFKGHPNAQPVERRMVWSLTLVDVTSYCDAIRVVEAFAQERPIFDDAARALDFYQDADNVQAEAVGAEKIADVHALAEQCRTAWDQLHALGVPDSLPAGGRISHEFGALRRAVCEPLDAAVDAYAAQAKQSADALRAKWERVGLAGERLKVMMDYDAIYWYLPGGQRTDDAKRLARAKVTFQWWTGTDHATGLPTHTIRKYRWKGNKLAAVTERAYVGSIGARAFK
jgi:hypothetical protein